MNNRVLLLLLLGFTLITTIGCGDKQESTTQEIAQININGRWYTQDQVERGKPLYQANCAVCHKPDASGTKDWKRLDENGKLPPPPLNGTAHTWHHPLSVLRRTVRNGGIPLGGSMPPFAAILKSQQIDDILAWVQSHWSDEVYKIWKERDDMSKKRTGRR